MALALHDVYMLGTPRNVQAPLCKYIKPLMILPHLQVKYLPYYLVIYGNKYLLRNTYLIIWSINKTGKTLIVFFSLLLIQI